MPKIVHLLNKQIIVARLAPPSGDYDKVAFATVTSAMAHIQPLRDTKTALTEGVHGKLHRLWVDGCVDIQAGDRVKDEDNNYYTIPDGGVSRRTFGSFDYKEIWLELTDS